MISFKDKILLITGGTGSFGNAVLRRFLTTDIVEIRILSRDEKKQDDMRHTYQELYPQHAEKIKFYIGDVRDYNSILNVFRGVDYCVRLTVKIFMNFTRIDCRAEKMSRRCTALYGKTGSCTLLYAGLAYRSPIQRQFLHAAVKYSTAGTSKIVFCR